MIGKFFLRYFLCAALCCLAVSCNLPADPSTAAGSASAAPSLEAQTAVVAPDAASPTMGLQGVGTPIGLNPVTNITLTSDAEGGSARPEIVATSDRVFVLYLGNITSRDNRTFNLKIYDRDLSTLIASKVLVSTDPTYGGPTDIRIDSDGQSVYAFYETLKRTSPDSGTTFLWGAKFTLDDRFERVAYTASPIASSGPLAEIADGEELLDDPAPLIGPNSVFAVTRIKDTIAKAGRTVYRVREFGREDLKQVSEFDLDLSAVADGRAQVASLLFDGSGSIFIALATTLSDRAENENFDDGALSDVLLVRMQPDWTFDPQVDARVLSGEPDDRENYISGFETDGEFFYLTYKQAVGSVQSGEQFGWIKIFNKEFQLVLKEKVTSAGRGQQGGIIRPSLALYGNRIYSGQSSGLGIGEGNAEVYVFDVIRG